MSEQSQKSAGSATGPDGVRKADIHPLRPVTEPQAPVPQPLAPEYKAPPQAPKPRPDLKSPKPGPQPRGFGRRVRTRPLADAAGMKRRHWGLLLGFFLMVVAPVVATGLYLGLIAEDQYASTTGFTVRKEEGAGATDFLGIIPGIVGGGGGAADSDVLYEFIQSQEIVERIDARLDLRAHYAQHWETDMVFSIWPGAEIEDLLWYWKRMVRISYDQPTGLIELRVLAFDPEFAQALARAIVAESQSMINDLSDTARADATRYAVEELEAAVERLKLARQALTEFRTRTQIVDPEADIQGRMGVLNNLQQQLAQALIEFDLLRDTANASDPRLVQAQRRIDVIRDRILREREEFTEVDETESPTGGDYPALIAEFESLMVDRQYAEQSYTAALAALDAARANAARQSRYLATYVQPTRAQSAEYPQRIIITALAFAFLLMFWATLVLVYYSIRDRR